MSSHVSSLILFKHILFIAEVAPLIWLTKNLRVVIKLSE